MSDRIILDATAALAAIFGETGGDFLEKLEQEPETIMTSVNAAEAVSKMIQRGFTPADARAAFREIVKRVLVAAEGLAFEAAEIHARNRALGLSMGDCFCLAAGMVTGVAVYTADREWMKLRRLNALGIRVVLIR